MDEEKLMLWGCLYAVNKLIEDGSTNFAHREDGKWQLVEWNKIRDYLINKLEEDKNE